MQVAIIKYNAGNVYSVSFALKRLGVDAMLTDDKEILLLSIKIALSQNFFTFSIECVTRTTVCLLPFSDWPFLYVLLHFLL